jgi:DNA-binding NarL/FixJ family response regulator
LQTELVDPELTQAERVLIVDDQRSFAQSLEVVIDAQDDMECVGTAISGEEAVRLAQRERPSVVLMDVDLPGMDGIEATAQVVEQDPEVAVVILTGIPDATMLARSASAGACAFLLKDSSVSEILDAVRDSHRAGHLDVDAAALGHMLGGSESPDPGERITQRELEVLGLLAQGRQPKEIARVLGISVHTCRGYVKNLLAKLDAHSALEAVVSAHRRGLISLGSRI